MNGTNTGPFSSSQFLALLTMVVTELVNDAVIDGNRAKLITGLAGIIIPAVWMLADAIIHHANAKVEVAKVVAATNTLPPAAS